jgi:formate hydrogenlyase subunit 3/multisubunit Na+/H+ antiporter MnhD subunit
MTGAAALLFATLAVPLAMLLACASRRARDYMPGLLALAPVPGLAAALLVPEGVLLVLPEPPFRMTLALDAPGAMLLGAAALLWICAGAYASTYLRGDPNAGRFAEWWLLTLTGSLGVFLAADLVSFYLTYSVVSLAAWGLIVHDGTIAGRRAGIIYVALAVLGEAFLLMAFVFMATAASDGSLLIRDTVSALPTSPWRGAAMALLILGFGLKIGLVPAHVWMPLAYTAAPIPAAAALSGAAVKAGVIGFIRFLPFGAAMPRWGEALAAAGLLSAFYGVLVGITQENPKAVLAYSSISQMGLLAAALGMGLAAGDSSAVLGTSFSAAHHVLVKGGLFLAIGAAAAGSARLWPVLIPAAVLALGLGGLPLTGGALAKLAVKAQFGESVVGTLATLSAAGSTLLMLHFLRRLVQTARGAPAATPSGYTWPWLTMAVMAVAVPWALFSATGSGSSFQVLAPAPFWSALWPVLTGGVLALGLWWWTDRLPRVPAGDIVVAGEAAIRSVVPWAEAIERADAYLRRWPVASLLLLTLLIALAAAMVGGS